MTTWPDPQPDPDDEPDEDWAIDPLSRGGGDDDPK